MLYIWNVKVVKLFSKTDFNHTLNKVTEEDRKAVLDFFTGTVKEIKSKLANNVTKDLEDNPYFRMMRNSFEASLKVSDYISEIKGINHPYTKGVLARKGIEY